ncbi:FimV/HubP family polar landmark protein [Shewanella litoralis]|uniref:Pilus assembly protein FimV n=1 Tax=Shewanella litoralis TaxID=2282700 RepID=A0ABQ2RLJ3_9GAMM|nr:FimV/HubP family polar landmark protein [Shewanella litoralis]GGQ33287.1 hypothetical protein GCM10009411_35990 [Shewanella litoralis]
MTLRTSYILGLIACTTVGLTSLQLIDTAQAETLKITGPNGEVKQQAKRQYGPTTSRDTFWSIAQKVRPNDRVSVYQVMAALFDANPHAFSGNNYNTLERGMILLIPSADVMAAIPDNVARRRAEQDDRRIVRQTPPPRVVTPKPVVTRPAAIVEVVKKPNADKPLQIVQQTPSAEAQTQALKQANATEVNDLNSVLDKANAKALMLTDELARAQDDLMVSNNDNQALKNKIGQMSLNISSLEEDLQLLNEKHDKLTIEYEKLLQQVGNPEPVVEEPTDFWRSLMDNTLMLIVAASVPLLLIFGLVFWLLTRRKKNNQSTEEQATAATETVAKQPTAPAADEDDNADDVVIHLDSDDDESIDDLFDLDNTDLQPEVSLANDGEMDMASDMFIGEDAEAEDDEGSSLDDLWAEAMEEQDSELEPLEDDDDLDSLLAGLDDAPAATITTAAPEDDLDSLLADFDGDSTDNDQLDASAENDIDSLLAEFDMPAESKPEIAEQETETKAQESVSSDDDIDSLLAEFDMPAESKPEVAEPEAEKPTAEESVSSDDDIDSLLAEFDMPAESKPEVAEPEAEKPSAEEPVSSDDDIDSLLAEFDMPAEPTSEPEVAEPEAKAQESVSNVDDIDSLLAEFDMPAESTSDVELAEPESDSELEALEPEPEKPTAEEPVSNDDDIDSLLAEFDMPAEPTSEPEVEEPEVESETESEPEIEPEVDSESAEPEKAVDESVELDETSTSDADELLAELELDTSEDEPSSDEDIDALLAGLAAAPTETKDDEAPLNSETVDTDDDLAALIAAELQDDDGEDESLLTETDDDIDALLASLNEPVIESNVADIEPQVESSQLSEEEDLAAQIAAELEDDSDDDSVIETGIDNASSQLNKDIDPDDDDIDALLASLNEPVAEQAEPDTDSDEDDVAAQIAAELADEDTNIAADLSNSSDEDIDALLASFDEPEMESPLAHLIDEESVFDANSLENAQGVAPESEPEEPELELEEADEALDSSLDITSPLDDDTDALLASFDQDIEDEYATAVADPDVQLDDNDADINDDDLFNELDEYLNDLDLNRAEDNVEDSTDNKKPAAEIDDSDKAFFDAELDALLAQSGNDAIPDEISEETSSGKLDEIDSIAEPDNEVDTDKNTESEFEADIDTENEDDDGLTFTLDDDVADDVEIDDTSEDELNALLATMGDDVADFSIDGLNADEDVNDAPEVVEDEPTQRSTKANKDSGFFNDLKANKPKPAMLDWESDLLKAAETAVDEQDSEPDVSDDDLLAAFSQSLNDNDDSDDYTSEDDYILSDDNLTVDEALAALDAKERNKSPQFSVSDDDLMSFERENGYIDIDKLLNDADEDDDTTDQYKDVDVKMGGVNSLIGNADMIDVDDEENSVNAKLDLARAYIEIEDQDSAKALLKEVQIDGNDRQQAEAANLLKGFR